MPSNLVNIVVERGFENGYFDVDSNKYGNRTNRCDVLLDVGHHFYDCPYPRVRSDMAQDQILKIDYPGKYALIYCWNRIKSLGLIPLNLQQQIIKE